MATTARRLPATPSSPELLARALRTVAQLGRAVAQAVVNRREVTRLLELDDRSLRDIGLLRGDVESSLSRPWRDDPSLWLGTRATDRRARIAGLDAATRDPGRR